MPSYYMSEDLARFGDISKTNPQLFDLFLRWYSATMEPGAPYLLFGRMTHADVAAFVAEPVMDAVPVDLSQVDVDCQVPVPPAEAVQLPCLFTTPWERVVTEDAVPEPPRLVV